MDLEEREVGRETGRGEEGETAAGMYNMRKYMMQYMRKE